MPKSNVTFWQTKWERNVLRDKRHEDEWRKLGWNVIIVWACALKPAVREQTLTRIHQALDARAARPHRHPSQLVLPHR